MWQDGVVAATGGGAVELKVGYAVCEALVAVCAIIGNGLVILVFVKERKLRRRTNYYIISLACADLLVGLFAIPFAVLASIGLPRNLHACLFTVSVLVVLCTISIFCLVAVSVDRYWAILHPMGYSRTVRTKTAIGIICMCWVAGTLVGFLPLLGWNAGRKSDDKCIFNEVMNYDYLVFLYFATIIFPALLIGAFYAHIYRVVVEQLQQIVTMNPGCKRKENETHGTMLRLLGAAQKREVKATQNLSRIVIFFIICWFPLYTINCVQAFCPQCQASEVLLNFCIILSHLNSAGNPLLYAYHLKDFRAALKSFIHGAFFPAPALAPPMAQQLSLLIRADATSAAHQRDHLVAPRPRNLPLLTATPSQFDRLAASSTSSRNKPGSISIITSTNGNNNNNNNNTIATSTNKMNNNSKKRILALSSPVSILGCSNRRDTVSITNSSTSYSSSNANSGQATQLGLNVAEATRSLPLTLELKTYEFEATLQFFYCDEDDDDDEAEEEDKCERMSISPASQPPSMLVVEADVNRVISTTDKLTNIDQVPGQ